MIATVLSDVLISRSPIFCVSDGLAWPSRALTMQGARVWARAFEVALRPLRSPEQVSWIGCGQKTGDHHESITVLEDGAVVAHVTAGVPLGAPHKWTLGSQGSGACPSQPSQRPTRLTLSNDDAMASCGQRLGLAG
jgi:hypothetical protein